MPVLSRVTTLTLAYGACATYAYDAAGRVTRVANVKSGGTIISSFDYSFDAVGNPTSLVEATGDRVTWSYDAKYQLTRERRSGTNAYDITYTYDAVGNRMTKLTSGVTTTYSYDAANQLTVENAGGTRTTYSYDANGNVSTVNAGGSATTYTWDGENRMATATLPGGAVTTFTYAATGLRRKTEVAGTTKVFVWDNQDVLLETDANGTTQAAYTQTPNRYGALVAQRRSGASSFYHFDALGSTTELSNTGQTVTDTYRYYAFGETKASTGSTVNPFGYVGRLGYYSEAALALQYLRARWYKPATGRFLSTDPVGLKSRYEYVGNRPVATVDPSGLLPPGYYPGPGGPPVLPGQNGKFWWFDPQDGQWHYGYVPMPPGGCGPGTPGGPGPYGPGPVPRQTCEHLYNLCMDAASSEQKACNDWGTANTWGCIWVAETACVVVCAGSYESGEWKACEECVGVAIMACEAYHLLDILKCEIEWGFHVARCHNEYNECLQKHP